MNGLYGEAILMTAVYTVENFWRSKNLPNP